jgi:hypothetical protein
MTSADRVHADTTIGRSDLNRMTVRLHALLARIASGEVAASPGFEQRLFGAVVAFELVAAGDEIDLRALVNQLR